MLSGPAGATDHVCRDVPLDASRTDIATVEWFTTDTTTPQLVIRAPAQEEVELSLEFEVRLGHLHFGWVDGPYSLAAAESRVVDVTLPAEAFLHDLATTWLTGLRVETDPINDRGSRQEMSTLAFLLWRDGPTRPPILWTRSEAGLHAPNGTTDAAVHAELAGRSAAIAPPLQDPLTVRRAVVDDLPEAGQSAQRSEFPEVTP